MKHNAILSSLVLAFFASSSSAAWYEATGEARIKHDNLAQARHYAVNDALSRAALFAGAEIKSSQQVLNGVLEHDLIEISSQHQVSELQLMSEKQQGNRLTVVIRANIQPQKVSACTTEQYIKPLLLSRMQLSAREDAIYGQLFSLDKDATTQLNYHLQAKAPAATTSVLDYSTGLSDLSYPYTDQLFRQGGQYIVTATIKDLSLGEETHRFWQTATKQRFFALNVVLYDLFEQSIVFQQEYRTDSTWPYKDKNTPAAHSAAFWQLPYGQKIDQLLEIVAEDIQQELQCKPVLTNITQVTNNQVWFNIGKKHGLEVGDKLQLIQVKRDPGQPELKRLHLSDITLVVRQVSQQQAMAEPATAALIQHIQAADIVSIHRKEED
ncbi:flagellar assembly protein T N-terminal domain-containing protein [Rheinheimera sp. WS51]|uniref:flagellar assembly protein T N-terminal domain-containing protein n=1 Tax=Rheinheimera sp. WS51 TaxID=3425886 RepID=UPI003D8F6620